MYYFGNDWIPGSEELILYRYFFLTHWPLWDLNQNLDNQFLS